MDVYITNLLNSANVCRVDDYAVYLEKKQGLARFNPLSAYSQLVVYITDKGTYCTVIDGLGCFGQPERISPSVSTDGKYASYRNNNFKFVRKQKHGKYLTLQEFISAI